MMKNRRTKLYLGLAACIALVAVAVVVGYDGLELQDGLTLAAGPAFAPLKWTVGRNNMGGFKNRVLFIPVDAVVSVPTVPKWEEAKDAVDLITAKGKFVFVTDGQYKMPIYLYATDATVGYTAEAQGETDGISYHPQLTCFFPGNMKEGHALAALIKNTPGYYVFEDVDGNQMMLGQDGLPATTSASYNGGQARADRRGLTLTAVADSNYSAIFLETPIDMEAVGRGTASFETADGGQTNPGGSTGGNDEEEEDNTGGGSGTGEGVTEDPLT